jgi:hypothetical protein
MRMLDPIDALAAGCCGHLRPYHSSDESREIAHCVRFLCARCFCVERPRLVSMNVIVFGNRVPVTDWRFSTSRELKCWRINTG